MQHVLCRSATLRAYAAEMRCGKRVGNIQRGDAQTSNDPASKGTQPQGIDVVPAIRTAVHWRFNPADKTINQNRRREFAAIQE